MSHELHVWFANLVCESRTIYMSHELQIWVTNDVYESRTMHDVQQQEGCTRGVLQRSCSVAYTPRTTYMSAESYIYECRIIYKRHGLYIWVSNYKYMSHASHLWVTNDVYESRTILDTYVSHGLDIWVPNSVYESRMMYRSRRQDIWVANYMYELWMFKDIYNTRKDVHAALLQRSRTALYEPHTTYMSHVLHIRVTDYT